ncbi:DMT family transporter [Planococcus sp. FY231025]|uniref:DMT family transporter n=1 Tax=Planococcus sp. FY231025 TaxID=3455699 RepID=UPI003F8DFC37
MKYKGVVLIIFAAICWGISGVIADILMSKGWSPIVISLYRGAIGLLFFSLWLIFRLKKNWVLSPRLYIWSAVAGVGVAGNFTFYFLSIQAASVAVAITLVYTAPVFVFIISFLLQLERSTWFKWACIAGVLAGIVLLTGAYDTGSISVSFVGAAAGLASALSYALFIFGFKKASEIGKPQLILTIAFFAFCLVLLVFSNGQETAAVLSSSDIGWFLLLGIVGAGLSFMLYVIGIRLTTAATASMVAMIEPVTASLLGVLVLGDNLTIIQILGMAIILFTITLLSIKQSS